MLDHILREWHLVRHYLRKCGLFWVGGGSWRIVLGGLGEWGWVEHYFESVGVGGERWG